MRIPHVVPQRSQPGTTTVVIVAPRNRVERRKTRMNRALRGQRALVDRREELDVRRVGYQVIPLIHESDAGAVRPDARGGSIVTNDLKGAVLKLAMIIVIGIAQQTLVIRPVVFRAKAVVNGNETPAGAHVLPESHFRLVEIS